MENNVIQMDSYKKPKKNKEQELINDISIGIDSIAKRIERIKTILSLLQKEKI
jgi:hypothetical protein